MSRFPLSRAFSGLTARGRETRRIERDSAAPVRPAGALVWVHAAGPVDAGALTALAREVAEAAPVTLLFTGLPEATPEAEIIFAPAPAKGRGGALAFLDHWQPDAAVFAGGLPEPALVTAAATHCPTTLVAPGAEPLAGADRAARTALRLLSEIWVPDAAAARAAGVTPGQLRLTGPLRAPPDAPPCIESDRADLAELLAARPVWLAARPLSGELDSVLEAHRTVLAIAHRAMLVLLPGEDCPADAELTERFTASGLSVATRAQGEEPCDKTEIYIADRTAPEEDGLWFRIAPFCFLGGTLSGDGPVQSWEPAAALGSAITFGPHGGEYGPGMARLAANGAAVALADGAALAQAASDLIAPDRAAELAHAAWSEMSSGAEVISLLARHLTGQLEARGVV